MKIREHLTKKNVIIGAVAGMAVVGGIIVLIVKHKGNKNYAFIRDFFYKADDFCDEDDIDEEYCGAKERCCTYAENICKEYEAGNASKEK